MLFLFCGNSLGDKMKKIIGVLGIIMAVWFIVNSSIPDNKESRQNASASDIIETTETASLYDSLELLQLDGHPRLFDDFEDIKAFYKDVKDERIAVVDVQGHSRLESKLKHIGDDPILMYMIRDSTQNKYLGTLQINLYEADLCQDMTLEKAIELIVSYLPEDFMTYYKKDSAYKYTQENTSVYTYAVRLKNHNNDVAFLPYYYNLKIFYYGDKNIWMLKTGVEAYGDHGIDWINKYAEEWDINLADYYY